MEHSTQMKRTIFLSLFCACSCFWGEPSEAQPASQVVAAPKADSVTRDNFVSLWWFQQEKKYYIQDGPTPFHPSFKVTGNIIHCNFSNEDKKEITSNLSDKQLDELIEKVNRINPQDGRPNQEFPEFVFTLFYSDEGNTDKGKDFVFFKNTAESNIELEIYLRSLVVMKFPELLDAPFVDDIP